VPGATLEVRSAGDPSGLLATLKDDIEQAHPAIHVTGVELQSTHVADTLVTERLLAILAAFFAMIAVVLVATGFYGVLNYSIMQRTKEIGIHMALGAQPSVLLRLLLGDIALLAAIGVAVGLAAGLALSRPLRSILFEVKPSDVWSVALPLACLLAASGAAAAVATARAFRVEPIVSLRQE
jgi:ABC-type antimicrobial peptide transport system permease subunit